MTPSLRLLPLIITIVVVGCTSAPLKPQADKFSEFQVLSNGYDKGGDFCSDFRLTPSQVQWFFSHAIVMDAQQLHDRLDHLPCWVRGMAVSSIGYWRWEIRAGGTARLISPTGSIELLGCVECVEALNGEQTVKNK